MDWNWPAIEAIAAIGGVIGVIISIIFLIYEVRHNARAIEGATIQSLMSLEREIFALLIDHPEVFRRGCDDLESLTPNERFQFDRLLGAQFSLTYSAFIQRQRNLIGDDVWRAYLNGLERYAATPGYPVIWENMKAAYPEEFQKEVEPIMTGKAPVPGQHRPWISRPVWDET